MAEHIIDGGMENWTTPTDLTSWDETIGGSSTINREAVEVDSGTYSCKFTVVSGGACVIAQDPITLVPGNPYILTIRAKSSTGTDTMFMRLKTGAVSQYLQPDGSWSESSSGFYTGDPGTSWATIVNIAFNAHADHAEYFIYISELEASATFDMYIDNVSIVDAGVINLIVADGTHGHAADVITLSQAHTLAVAEAIHNHLADNIDLIYGAVICEYISKLMRTAEYTSSITTQVDRTSGLKRQADFKSKTTKQKDYKSKLYEEN